MVGVSKLKRSLDNLRFAASVGAQVGRLVVLVRGKPRAIDLAALGVEAASAGLDAWERYSKERSYSVEDTNATHWLHTEGWFMLHPALKKPVEEAITNAVVVTDVPSAVQETIIEAQLGDERVRWLTAPDKDGRPSKKVDERTAFYFCADRYTETMNALSEAFWARAPSREVHFDGGRVASMPEVSGIRDTQFIRDLEARCRAFVQRRECRGMLLDGVPGTGKSQAVREVLRRLNLRVLHLDRSVVAADTFDGDSRGVTSGDMMIRFARPDAIVIDDIDRLQGSAQARLFASIEHIKGSGFVKLLLATSNRKDELLAPILRPGRLDDMVAVPDLEEEVVREILGPDADLAPDMKGWPVAYVRDYVARREALGAEAARAELPELAQRVAITQGAQSEPEPERYFRVARDLS